MKKTILSFLLIGSAGLAMAQQQPATSNPDRTKINNANTNSNLNSTQTTNPTNTNPPNPNSAYPQNTNVPPTNQPNQQMNMNSTVDTALRTDPNAQPFNNNIDRPVNTTVTNTSTTYELNVPASIQSSFRTSYPNITTNSWYQSGDWYVTRYIDNGQIKQISYREDGKVLNAMMSPVRKSFVPDEIVNQAIQRYGANLYAIGSSKGADGAEMYNVTLIENGQSRTEWMNTDGSTADNHFRQADEATMNVNQQSNTNTQEQSEMTTRDSTVNQPVVTDSTSLDDKRPEHKSDSSMPQNEDRDNGNNNTNQEGINNASEINGSPKRLY